MQLRNLTNLAISSIVGVRIPPINGDYTTYLNCGSEKALSYESPSEFIDSVAVSYASDIIDARLDLFLLESCCTSDRTFSLKRTRLKLSTTMTG